jgi:hypothetical protein
MEVEGGVVSLTCTGRTRDLLSYQYHNRSDVPASCIVGNSATQTGRTLLRLHLKQQNQQFSEYITATNRR